jgi:hypothetical protein
MALAIHFTTNLTLEQYNEIWRQLDAADLHDPKGRLYHVSWGGGDAIEVLDLWQSAADFDAFGAKLMPIAASLGAEVTPNVNEAHKIVTP